MPRLMIRCGAKPEISAPSNFIEPEVGANVPESMLKIVLLPEPCGPIRPRISPRSTLNDTLLTALKPPNRLTRLSTTSTAVPSVAHSVFERSMPSDLIRGWAPVRVKKTRQTKIGTPVLMPSEPRLQDHLLVAIGRACRQRQHSLA